MYASKTPFEDLSSCRDSLSGTQYENKTKIIISSIDFHSSALQLSVKLTIVTILETVNLYTSKNSPIDHN